MEDDNEYLKLPIEDQCVHKNWKARVHGYEAALKLFQQWDEKSPDWNKYTSLIKKFVVDSNAVAQEKGLETVLAFVENSANASKTTQDVLNGIVTKCLGAQRAKTKELGMHIALMYVEIEKYEAVQEIFVGALSSQKNPKVVAACVATLTRMLNEFGLKVINVKPLLKAIPPILEDRDKNVREEGKHLMIELYRWIGQALKPQLSNLKPIQVSELEAEFEKLGNEKPLQTRFLRSQQDLKAKFEAKAAGLDDEEEEEEEQAAPEIDPLELIEAVDILSKLPKDFYEKCEAKKWLERKEAMEELEKLVANPKLESGDYADLVRALKKIIAKDTNVNVIANAGKNLAGLANGLKKKFSPYAASCISVILDKFKEKKPNVVVAMREAIDAIYPSTNLEAIQEDALAALDNKNPSIKAETASFLARCFTKCTPVILTKKLLKAYVTALLKTFNDSDATVREASAEALGTAMKVVGEKGILPFLGDLEALKMAKLKECCEKAVLLVKVPGAKVVKPKEPPKPPEPAKSGPVIKKPAPSAGKSAGPSQPKQGAGAGPPKAAPKKGAVKASATEEKQEKELSQEEVDEKFAELFPPQVVSDLVDSNWKSRLAAMEQILQQIRFLEKNELPVQVVLRSITKKPGLKDTNFQVLKLKMEAVKVLAERGDFSKKSAEFSLSEITEKLGDVKNSGTAAECLTAMAEAIGLDWVAQEVMTFTLGQKNPKVHAEALNWTSEAIKEFGFVVQPKAVIEFSKKSVQASNPAIRTAGITLAGTLYLYMGSPLRTFFEGEKAALLTTLDAEFEKHAGVKPPGPVRGLKPTQGRLGGSGDAEEEAAAAPISVQDLVPRTDISGQFTGPIITELGDKNWKVRNEALQKVETIIKEAKFITPNLGELPPALAQRLTDSNKILVQTGLSICQQLAVAMGIHTKQHVRTLLPGILQSLSDNKANVRQTAITTMNIIAEQCGSVKEFFEAEMIADALKGGNPYLKADLLAWIAEKLGNATGINKDDLKACLPQLYACVEDRSADVRKGAQDAVLPFMIVLGYEPMMRAAQNLKPSSKNTIVALLEKTRPNLPAKPQPPPVASSGFATTVRTKSAATTKIVHPVIDDDEPSASKHAEKKPASNRAPSKSRLPSANAKAAPGRQKKEEEIDTSPLLQSNTLKNQRFNDELKLKALKWNFASPRDEFIDQLRDQMTTANFSKSLMQNMFHVDFKMHIKAIEALQDDLNEGNIEAQKANLDLLLKWMTIRFFDTNPSVLIKGLEYLSLVFGALSQDDYRMHDLEASSFVPYLITKIGDPKDAVKNSVHQIVRQMCKVVPTSRLFAHLMEGLKSKNARQRSECLEELGYFIENYGNVVYQGSPFLKEIAKQIADRDNSVRNSALNCIVQAYFVEGDKVRNMIGQLAEKDLAMLEERIKRAGKNRPVAAPPAPKQSSPESKLPQSRIGRPGSAPAQPALNNNIPKAPEVEARRDKVKSCHEEAQHLLDLEGIENQIDKTLGIQAISINDVYSKLKKADLEGIDIHPAQIKRETSIPRPSPTRPTLEPITHRIAAIDVAIAQILDDNVQKCIQALLQVEQALQQDPMMIAKVDSILRACTEQLQRNAEENSRTEHETLKVYQTCLRTLHSLYSNDILGLKGSTESLQRLMPTLLDILVDPRFEGGSNEASNISKQTNILIVRVVEKSDHTAITSTLLRLLLDSVESKGPGSKYVDLVQKCLWKVIRSLPEWITTTKVEVLLQDINDFMKAYPSTSWKSRESDMPLRTIKTVLHTLVKHLGRDILNSLNGIEDLSKSELFLYLKKILAQGGLTSKESRSDGSISIQSTSMERAKTVTQLTKEDQSRLTGIIRKIGTRELTRQGLEELYDFKQAHPDADLSPFFQKSSDFFRSYIERGLSVVEKDRKVLGSKAVGTEPRSIPVVKSEPDQLNLYKERLKQIRINSGLDQDTENKQVIDNPLERLRAIKTKSSSMNEIASLRVSQAANISEETVIKTEESQSLTYQSSNQAVNGGSTQLTSRLEQLRSRLAFVKQSSQQ